LRQSPSRWFSSDCLDVKLISDQLGHAKVGITQDTYQHVRRERHDAAAETVDALVFGTRAERRSSNEPT
jgi:integrase